MNNGEHPAFPTEGMVVSADGKSSATAFYTGLTKRELFSVILMLAEVMKAEGGYLRRDLAREAIENTDALIAELAKSGGEAGA